MGLIKAVLIFFFVFLILIIGALDLSINIISFIPYFGGILESLGEVVLEALQMISLILITVLRGGFKKIDMIIAGSFLGLGIIDAFLIISWIPFIGPIIEFVGEAGLEALQIILAFIKAIT